MEFLTLAVPSADIGDKRGRILSGIIGEDVGEAEQKSY